MKWLQRLTPSRAFVAVSLREGLTAVRVEPGATPGSKPRVTLAMQHPDVRTGARQLRSKGMLRGAQQLLVLPGALRSFHALPRPKVPDSELVEAVRWQLSGNLEYPADEALVQVLTMPELSDNPQQQLLAVVAHGPTVREHLAPLHESGWAPEIVDIEETAQRNLMLLSASQNAAGVCVGFAGDEALITLVAGGELCLTRLVTIERGDSAATVERLALQVQRVLDGFERQTTRFAIRSVQLLPGQLCDRLAAALAMQLSQRLTRTTLSTLFDTGEEAALVLDDPVVVTHLLGSVAGRLQMPAAVDDAADSAAAATAQPQEPSLDFDSQPPTVNDGLAYDTMDFAAAPDDTQRRWP